MKKKRSVLNVLSSLISQLSSLALGLIIPRLVLVNLGSESNGLITSINNVLTYVALLEAGVGAASMQALYKPISEQDTKEINAILSATAHFYRKTGVMYFSAVVLLTLIFPLTVKTEIPAGQVMLVVCLSGLPGVASYFFQGKYRVFLMAEGKGYFLTNLGTFFHFLTSVIKILLLNTGFGIVAVQTLGFVSSLLQVVCIEIYIHRHYRWINLKEPPAVTRISQSKNALVHQIAWLITSNTDTIILTYFCGFKVVSVYAIYAYLFGFLDGLIGAVTNGVHFAMGQTYQSDTEGYQRIHGVYEVCIITACFAFFTIAAIFTNPFLKLYTANVNDIQYCDPLLPYLFAAVHILVQARATSWKTISVAGHFKETQHQPIIEAIVNLTISLALVPRFGIYGVLAGTVVASSYRLVAMIHYSRRKLLGDKSWITVQRYFVNIILTVIVGFLSKSIMRINMDTYLTVFISAVIVCLIVLPVYFAVNLFFEKESLAFLLNYAKMFWKRDQKDNES